MVVVGQVRGILLLADPDPEAQEDLGRLMVTACDRDDRDVRDLATASINFCSDKM